MLFQQCTVERLLAQPSLEQTLAPELLDVYTNATEYHLYVPQDILDEEDADEVQ